MLNRPARKRFRLNSRAKKVSLVLALLTMLCALLAERVLYKKSPVAGLYVESRSTPHPSMLLLRPDGVYYHYFYRPSKGTYGIQRGHWHRDKLDTRYTFTNMCFYPSDHEGPTGGPPGVGGYWCPHLHRNLFGRAEFRPNIDLPDRCFVWQAPVAGMVGITESTAGRRLSRRPQRTEKRINEAARRPGSSLKGMRIDTH